MSDEVKVKVSATVADLKRSMDEAEKTAKDTAKDIEKAGNDINFDVDTNSIKQKFGDLANDIKSKFKNVGDDISATLSKSLKLSVAGIGAAVIAGAVGLGAVTQQVGENAKAIENQARLINATTTELQEWTFASSKVGVEQEKLSDIMKDVNDKLGDYMQTGGGEMADFFDNIAPKVGVTAKEFQGLSGPQVLGKYYDTLQKANVSHAEMVFYMESVADEASLLSPLLENNGEKLKQYAEQAHQLGVIMDAETIAKTKEFNSALGLVQQTMQGVANRMAAEVAPALTSLANDFLTFATENRQAIDDSVSAIISIFQDLLGIVQDVFGIVGGLWSDLTATTGNESIQQIGFIDILKGALQALAIAVNVVRSGIQVAWALIRQAVVEALAIVNEKVIYAERQFLLFRTNVEFYLSSLSIALKTFASIAENALKLNFSAVHTSWQNGFNQLESLASQRSARIGQIMQSANNKALANVAVRDEGRAVLKATGANALLSLNNMMMQWGNKGEPAPAPTPSYAPPNIAPSIGTGATPKAPKAGGGGSGASNAEAQRQKAERERQEQDRKAQELKYKYASEEEKINLDLAKALKAINESVKSSDDEKRAYSLKAEQDASDKRKQLKIKEINDRQALEEEALNEERKAVQRQFDLEMARIQAEFDAGRLSNVDKATLEKQLQDQLYTIKRDALLKQLALEEELAGTTGNYKPVRETQGQISDLDAQKAISDTKQTGVMSDAEMADFEAKFGDLTTRMSSLWDKGIEAMMNGTLTWKNATNAVLTDMSSFALQTATQELQHWAKIQAIKLARKYGFISAETTAEATGQAAQTGAAIAGETARTSATSMGVLARLALKAGEAIKTIMMYAWEAMAGAFKAMVSIPYIGPVLAVGAGAAALGLVSGIAGNIKSARGGYDIPAGVNPVTQLHEEEMVLPQKQANTIRSLGDMVMNQPNETAGVASESAGVTNLTVQAWDSKDVHRFMKKHGSALAEGLKGYNRKFGR